MNHSTDPLLLRVVVVARNEELTVGRCLDSVIREMSGLNAEVVLVDSASTDHTPSVAASYPVKVIRLPDSQLLSPAAGRYAGSHDCRADFLLFLDGDMILVAGWLRDAMSRFSDPSLGGVAGVLYNLRPGEEPHTGNPITTREGDVPLLGGAALYRGPALLECGTFAPSLFGEEERELAFRLKERGYVVRRVAGAMAYHFLKQRTRAELDEKSKYFTGVGQIARNYFPRRIVWDLAGEHKELLIFNLVSAGFLAGVVAGWVAGIPWLVGAALAGVGAILLLLGFWKGFDRLALYVRSQVLSTVNVLRGFRRGLEPADRFMRRLMSDGIQTG